MSALLEIPLGRDSNHKAAASILCSLERGEHIALFGRVGSGVTPFLKLLAFKNRSALYHRPVDTKMRRLALPEHQGKYLLLDDVMVGITLGLPPIEVHKARGVVAFLNTDKLNRVVASWNQALPALKLSRVIETPMRGVFKEHAMATLRVSSGPDSTLSSPCNYSAQAKKVFA